MPFISNPYDTITALIKHPLSNDTIKPLICPLSAPAEDHRATAYALTHDRGQLGMPGGGTMIGGGGS
jgi:hypothetical protein